MEQPDIFSRAGRHCLNFTDGVMRTGGPWMFNQGEVALLAAPLKGLTKKQRSNALGHASGKFILYSVVEAVNPGGRVSTSNPARVVYALVCDYDHPYTDEGIQFALDHQQKAGLPMPHWIEVSLSGQLHCVWFFEVPLIGPGEKALWDAVLEDLAEKIGAKNFYPGVDAKSWDVTQIWTASGNGSWVENDDGSGLYPPVKKSLLEGLLDQHMTEWSRKSGTSESDMTPERVLPMLQEKYKETFQWDGDFKEGTLGPTFWLEGSQSPKSAKVLRNGLYSFSDTAAQMKHTFWTWAELIGPQAYAMHKAADLPERLEGIWHDGSRYYIAPADGNSPWRTEDLTGINRYLECKRGVSVKVPKVGRAEIKDAVEFIHSNRKVSIATKVAFRPSGPLPGHQDDGSLILNLSTGRVMPPAQGVYHWGPGGGFELISSYLDAFLPLDLNGVSQCEYIKVWLSLFYRQAYAQRMGQGQVVVIVGEPGSGKTFFLEFMLTPLFRLVAKAEVFLTSDTQFNGPLYAGGLWSVDDVAKTGIDPVQLGSKLKKELTQTLHRSENKFQDSVHIEWQGRCVILTNPDVDSLMVVPPIDEDSNASKFLLMKCCPTGTIDFSNKEELIVKIRAELPAFAAWLLTYEPPAWIKKDNRFGFTAYHHPEVKDMLELSNQNFAIVEYLNRWLLDVAETDELKHLVEVAYSQPDLIASIEASWASDVGHNTPLTRQLYDRRFVQRLSHLIEQKKVRSIRHVKDAESGSRKWVLNLEEIRKSKKTKKKS